MMKIRLIETDFQYHPVETLKLLIGKNVLWIDLFGTVRLGKLEGTTRAYLPEACNPYADTVKIKLL